VRLEVGGHTDNVGKEEYNKELSQRRAESVKAYMVSKGISSDRLTAVGYGMDKPLTSNKTAKDKAKNRRTEFTLIK
jgi:OOP family OmpA-OmpF porin